MKDKDVFEALGGKQAEDLLPRECPIKSVEDKSLLDDNGQCGQCGQCEQWDREVSFKTASGEGKVNCYISGEYNEYVNSLVACAVLAVASTKKINSKGK